MKIARTPERPQPAPRSIKRFAESSPLTRLEKPDAGEESEPKDDGKIDPRQQVY